MQAAVSFPFDPAEPMSEAQMAVRLTQLIRDAVQDNWPAVILESAIQKVFELQGRKYPSGSGEFGKWMTKNLRTVN